MGKVMGDLSSRRGKIQGMDMEGGFQMIKAHRAGQGTLPLLQHPALAHRRARRACGVIQPLRGNAARGGAEGHRGKQARQAGAAGRVGGLKSGARTFLSAATCFAERANESEFGSRCGQECPRALDRRCTRDTREALACCSLVFGLCSARIPLVFRLYSDSISPAFWARYGSS